MSDIATPIVIFLCAFLLAMDMREAADKIVKAHLRSIHDADTGRCMVCLCRSFNAIASPSPAAPEPDLSEFDRLLNNYVSAYVSDDYPQSSEDKAYAALRSWVATALASRCRTTCEEPSKCAVMGCVMEQCTRKYLDSEKALAEAHVSVSAQYDTIVRVTDQRDAAHKRLATALALVERMAEGGP